MSLEMELLNAPLVTLEQEKVDMKSNSGCKAMKNVKNRIVALLGYLEIDSVSSETQAESINCNSLKCVVGVRFPRTPP